MEQYLLDEGELNDAMIRRWAFDPDAELAQQDEDLALHDWRFAETILDLAADPNCPKADYILDIWDDFTRNQTLHQVSSDLKEARHALVLAEQYNGHSGLARWIADQTARLNCVEGVGIADRAKALSIGDTVLNGAGRSCPLEVLSESDTAILIQMSSPHSAHKEWLSVEKQTGKFQYSRLWRDGEPEPRWFAPSR
ncbi:hypothetical protein [Sphingobium yanoikuyae]|uniref:hypothetical protein n=1 Tax=Sphingobium yanoikuyae TaxID=13690 RepID=UPI0022DE8A2D|nr:hypothetical protein [Sphingobium yanoikuyae]WBQ17860.1 hypothetical protein PAE53_06565 [Sphingobium yanoikuyae]